MPSVFSTRKVVGFHVHFRLVFDPQFYSVGFNAAVVINRCNIVASIAVVTLFEIKILLVLAVKPFGPVQVVGNPFGLTLNITLSPSQTFTVQSPSTDQPASLMFFSQTISKSFTMQASQASLRSTFTSPFK